ncbi:MAG: fibronectin type III domain-containing protein, partial [Gammaproteobacteria bacterium]|nr:fibronectin type III domain-containing protein [Gammaproteobacteria bacterium]
MHPFTRSPSFLSSLAIAVGLMLFAQPAVAAQTAPTFDDGDETTLSIAENHADTATVGRAAATDADRDTLTYSLVGADAGTFTIDGNGDIKVVAGTTLDFETRSSYSVTAQVTDGKDPSGGDEATATTDDEISVAINVIDMAEAPGKPRAPWVLGSGTNSVRAGWREPSNTGPPIVDYDVQYRMSGEDDWRTEEHDGAHDHNLIPNLIAGAIYEVRVRASNAEGTGDWSDAGRGTVLGASISSVEFTNKPSRGYFAIGGHIEVTVGFNQPVTVAGTPRIKLNLAAGGTRNANYVSGSPGTELVFQYTLADGDDSGGTNVSVDADALDADGAERVAYIRVGTADVDASHDAVSSGKPAEAHRPRITGVRWDRSRATVDSDLDGNNDTIVEDDIVEIFVHFDREVLVPGSNSDAEIDIEVGSATHSTRLHLFTDTILVFHHRVAAGDMDGDGVTVKQVDAAGNLIRLLNDGTLASPPWKGNNDAVLTFAETVFAGLKVRGTNATPRGSNFTRSTIVDSDLTFALGDFPVADSDGDPLKEIRVVTLPTSTQGALELGGAPIASADLPKTVTRAQLSNGDLVFDPATGFAGRATFEFKVVDPFGAASGATRATIEVESASQVLAFEAGGPKAPTALSVAENNAPGAEVGTVAATDPEGDPLTYSLDEASDAVFDINGDGRITVAAANALDYEATATYAVTVSASDGTNTATHSLTIFVTNVEEPPGAPTGVTAVGVASAATNLSVTWSAPTHIGVRLDGYDVEYRRTGSTAWTAHGHDGTGTATTIANLDPATEYDVQVRAKGDGNSAWASGRGRTAGVSAGNRAPRVLEWHNGACRVMPDPTKTRKFRNSPAGTLVNSGLLTTRGSETTDLPSSCARGVFVPIFDDQDGDALTYTLEYERPDRVVSGLETPFVRDNRVWHQGVAEFEAADMRVKVTATDPHGASAFAYLVFQVGTYANVNGAPSFGATTVPNQNVVRGRR